jgi:DNA-binding NarL/FixJ family response regulator
MRHPVGAVIRVLVVDDHPILRAGVETVLRAEPGFTCVGTAAGSDELWPLLRRTRPHVVLLDRRLGDEDGVEICRELRGEPAAPAVVLFTAERSGDLEPLARAAGAAAVVDKSADPALLFDQLRLAARGVFVS